MEPRVLDDMCGDALVGLPGFPDGAEAYQHRCAGKELLRFRAGTRGVGPDVVPDPLVLGELREGRPVSRLRAHELESELVGPQASFADDARTCPEQRMRISVEVDGPGIGDDETVGAFLRRE